MVTSTDTHVLTLAQWFSPGFPVGAFHFSQGLETAIDGGWVWEADSLLAWIEDVLCHGSGRADALFLAAARAAETAAELERIDRTARAYVPSSERLFETVETGRAFGKAVAPLLNAAQPEFTYPVAVGHAARQAGLPGELTAQMYLQAQVANFAAVGMRLIPVGQTDGQHIIATLAPFCRRIAAETADGDLSRLGSCTFVADVASMQHETQYSRIFRT